MTNQHDTLANVLNAWYDDLNTVLTFLSQLELQGRELQVRAMENEHNVMFEFVLKYTESKYVEPIQSNVSPDLLIPVLNQILRDIGIKQRVTAQRSSIGMKQMTYIKNRLNL